MKANTVLIVLASATLVAVVLGLSRSGETADPGLDERLSGLDARLDAIEELVRDTREEARRATRAASAPRATRAPVPQVAGVSAGLDDEDVAAAVADGDLERVVAESVERTVEAQMERIAVEKRHRGWDGKWKPPIDDMAQVLELSETQREALRTAFDAARDEAFALLRTQRDDGGSLLDDFVADLRTSEDQKQAWTRFLGGIASQKVPGRNQTYLAALAEAEVRVRDQVLGHLDEEQGRRFRSLSVDVFDVKTGYDPAGDYVRAGLEQAED